MKKFYLLLIFFLFAVTFACNKGSKTQSEQTSSCGCGVKDPLNDFNWIKKVLTNSYSFSNGAQLIVYTGAKFYCCIYNEQNVFYLDNPASSLSISNQMIFDCDGNIVMMGLGNPDFENFYKNKTEVKLLCGSAD
jgi:hypothetical protein